jgi:PTS system sucrose-specific IIC component
MSPNVWVRAATGYVSAALFLPMVAMGMHHGLVALYTVQLQQMGYITLYPALCMAGAGQVGASLAVYFKTKNRCLKRAILSALPVGVLGIGEPLIYGVTLPLGRPFLAACLGGAVGGAWQAHYLVGAAASGISGLPLALASNRIKVYIIGILIAYLAGFIATWLIGFDDLPETSEEI